ncbi:hypothetical protein ACFPES_04850 [Paenibacillus sp. GCM10023248]|uniref:hypothetical protein n=1 Tax=Bacillales TaxID=1385 RepID=UPI002379DF56|nr:MULTISPECIES: hypothetical protein [Bacillales]MDD9266356.1 hypothetical protein [Paenibacillus sp. MAHUQ-63]MDR6878480.1 hypothetical protein [Bacillus sp. 3255]
MFEKLISCKNEVSIRCGKDEIRGVITNYYSAFRLVKISNVLIPIELIEQIEVLTPASPSSAATQIRRGPLRLVAQKRLSN